MSSAAPAARLVYCPSTDRLAPVDATIAITTKDRWQELMVAVGSACDQTGCSCEVMVIDDGSSDGTAERVHERFARVTVYRSESSRGLVPQRNFIASVARGRYIVSIDDDAELVDRTTVARTLADFEAGNDIGAVAIPYLEPKANGQWVCPQQGRGGPVEIIDAFRGTAYAVRRDVFSAVGGFWEHPRNEERDFCVRLLQHAYLVRLGTAAPLLHRPSQNRSDRRAAFDGRRSDLLFAYRNVPRASLPWHLLRTTANAVHAALVIGHGRYAADMARGYLAGLGMLRHEPRAPVSADVYRLHLWLRRNGPLSADDVRREAAVMRTLMAK